MNWLHAKLFPTARMCWFIFVTNWTCHADELQTIHRLFTANFDDGNVGISVVFDAVGRVVLLLSSRNFGSHELHVTTSHFVCL